MNYAIIEDGIVTNLIWLYPDNAVDFPEAVPCEDYPVFIGDTYQDGVFYHEGERLLSREEMAAQRTAAENADMRAALELLGVTLDE